MEYMPPVRRRRRLSASCLLIRSDSPSDQNTLENPRRIVPSEKPLEGCSKMFGVVLPRYSVNLLRVPAE